MKDYIGNAVYVGLGFFLCSFLFLMTIPEVIVLIIKTRKLYPICYLVDDFKAGIEDVKSGPYNTYEGQVKSTIKNTIIYFSRKGDKQELYQYIMDAQKHYSVLSPAIVLEVLKESFPEYLDTYYKILMLQ